MNAEHCGASVIEDFGKQQTLMGALKFTQAEVSEFMKRDIE